MSGNMNREELERREFEEAFKEFDKVRKKREEACTYDVRRVGAVYAYKEMCAKL